MDNAIKSDIILYGSDNAPDEVKASTERYIDLISDLNSSFLEMSDEIRTIMVGLICKKNVCLIGPPGTAKSELVKAISSSITDAKGNNNTAFFTYLLNRYTTPDELLGHFSLKELKENDKQVRNVSGKMPEARFAFLDEWEKGNSGTQNALLTIMNEREYDVGDGTRATAPLEMVVGASNGYIKDPALAALWDRWFFRVETSYVKKDDNFLKLILKQGTIGKDSVSNTVSWGDIDNLREAALSVSLDGVVSTIMDIRQKLAEKGIVVSDRRWYQCVSAIQANAVLNGNRLATDKDCRILKHSLWNTEEQRTTVNTIINESCAGDLSKVQEARAIADSFMLEFNEISSSNGGSEFLQKLLSQKHGMEGLINDCQKYDVNDQDVQDIVDSINNDLASIRSYLLSLVSGPRR